MENTVALCASKNKKVSKHVMKFDDADIAEITNYLSVVLRAQLKLQNLF